jgi:crotonobetainyl-CoA:carnitine CoA-transferase CaiB-like acyl-CoA transferase
VAGLAASRFLAGYGADVLRVDPPGWNEANIVPEVRPGKRCTRLDLKSGEDRVAFEALLADAHVLLHNYRSDALDRLGYDAAARRALAPGLVDVALCAYGWSGPWAKRRGFDSLVQMSTGIADTGMRQRRPRSNGRTGAMPND